MKSKSPNKPPFYEEAVKAAAQKDIRKGPLQIGKVVRALRTIKKLSGVEFCRKAGLDVRMLNAVEMGRVKNPSMDTLQRLAQGLEISVSALFGLAEKGLSHYFYQGTQKGFFQMELTGQGVRIVSFAPPGSSFFYGKLIFSSRKKVSQLIADPQYLFLSILVGSFEVQIEDDLYRLREGESLYFNAASRHSVTNLLQKESSLLLVTAPSFL